MKLIDADKLIEDAELCYVKVGARSNGKSILTLAKTWLLNEVESAPTVEAKPVVHAHWEEIANGFMVCSHCKESVEENRKYSYCPICGAQMDEVIV